MGSETNYALIPLRNLIASGFQAFTSSLIPSDGQTYMLFSLALLLILCVRVFCLNVRLYTEGGQKRAAGPWELELHIVVSHQVGSGGTKPESFARATSC